MKFMLLQYYGGVEGLPPMAEWTPEEAQAHIDFQLELNAELRESGELVEAQALTAPELAKRVVSDGGAPVVTCSSPTHAAKRAARLASAA